MKNDREPDYMDRSEFCELIHEMIQDIWQIRLADDGDFHCEITADYLDEIAEDDIKKICMSKNPEIAFGEWIEKRYDDSKEMIRTDVVGKITDNLEKEIGDILTEEQETWLGDYVRYHFSFDLPEEHFLKQKIQANVYVDTGDSDYTFRLNSLFLSGEADPSNGAVKSSIVWLAETQGYSEQQLTVDKNHDVEIYTYPTDTGATFLETLKNQDFPSYVAPLVFLTELTVGDLIRVNSQLKNRESTGKEWDKLNRLPDDGIIHISKGTTTLLFDPWFTGAGTVDSLMIEKNIDMPLKFAYSVLPDGAEGKYSVKSVYGMPDSAWHEATVDISEFGPAERRMEKQIRRKR